ncbi:hypothetical protein Tco_0453295 [Tanacetum coccineum]
MGERAGFETDSGHNVATAKVIVGTFSHKLYGWLLERALYHGDTLLVSAGLGGDASRRVEDNCRRGRSIFGCRAEGHARPLRRVFLEVGLECVTSAYVPSGFALLGGAYCDVWGLIWALEQTLDYTLSWAYDSEGDTVKHRISSIHVWSDNVMWGGTRRVRWLGVLCLRKARTSSRLTERSNVGMTGHSVLSSEIGIFSWRSLSKAGVATLLARSQRCPYRMECFSPRWRLQRLVDTSSARNQVDHSLVVTLLNAARAWAGHVVKSGKRIFSEKEYWAREDDLHLREKRKGIWILCDLESITLSPVHLVAGTRSSGRADERGAHSGLHRSSIYPSSRINLWSRADGGWALLELALLEGSRYPALYLMGVILLILMSRGRVLFWSEAVYEVIESRLGVGCWCLTGISGEGNAVWLGRRSVIKLCRAIWVYLGDVVERSDYADRRRAEGARGLCLGVHGYYRGLGIEMRLATVSDYRAALGQCAFRCSLRVMRSSCGGRIYVSVSMVVLLYWLIWVGRAVGASGANERMGFRSEHSGMWWDVEFYVGGGVFIDSHWICTCVSDRACSLNVLGSGSVKIFIGTREGMDCRNRWKCQEEGNGRRTSSKGVGKCGGLSGICVMDNVYLRSGGRAYGYHEAAWCGVKRAGMEIAGSASILSAAGFRGDENRGVRVDWQWWSRGDMDGFDGDDGLYRRVEDAIKLSDGSSDDKLILSGMLCKLYENSGIASSGNDSSNLGG